MGIEYILGRARTKKKELLFKNIKEDIENSNIDKVLLIVPEQYTLHSEFDAIKSMKTNGLLKLEVSSFKLLAYQGLHSMGIEEETIDDVGKYIFINKIVSRNIKKLKVFRNLKEEGMIEEILKTIDYFKENMVTDLEILDKLGEFKENSILKAKLEDISLIYSEYEKEIQNNYIDSKDFLQKYIKECHFKEINENVKVYFSDFNGFNKIEYEIIRGIVKKSKKSTFVLDYDYKDKELFASTERTILNINKIAIEEKIKYNMINLEDENKDDEIDFLEKNLYSYRNNQYLGENKKINIIKGLNRNEEIELVASNISKISRELGYRWKDILIVNNNMEIYRGIVKRIFSKYKIPFFIDETSSITNTTIVSYVENFLDMIRTNMNYERVFTTLKTGFSNLEADEIDIIENYVLELGIKGKKWFEEINIPENYEKEEIDKLEKIENIRKKFIVENNIEELYFELKEKKTPKEFNEIVLNILDSIKSHIQEKVDYFFEKNLLEKGNETVQVWNGVLDILNQINNISDDKKITLREYIVDIKAGMSIYEIGSLPTTLDQVIIGKLERSRAKDIKVIFVVGLNDGVLPSNGIVDSILTEEEQEILKKTGIDINNRSNEKLENERFYSYMAMSKATDILFLSYSLSTNEGETLRSSIILERIKKLFPKSDKVSVFNEEKFKDIIYTPENAIYFLTQKLREFKEEGNISEEWVDLIRWFKDKEEYGKTLEIIFRGMFESEQLSNLDETDVNKLYPKNINTSISSLETFKKCPFSHFMRYGVRPKERKNREIKNIYVGNILHTVMEKYFTENNISNLISLDKDKSDEIVENTIDNITGDYKNSIFKYNYKNMYYLKHLKRIGKKAAWIANLQSREGEVERILSEVSFGEDKNLYNGLSLKTKFRDKEVNFSIQGKIDRIDIYNLEDEKFANIIDYKSGKKEFSLSELYYGVQIQLIVYLMVMIENKYHNHKINGDSNYKPGGIFYFKIDDPIVESVKLTQNEILDEVKKSMKLSGLAVKNIDLIQKIDKNILEELKSKTLKVNLKKGSTIETPEYYDSSELIEEDELDSVILFIKDMLKETVKEILEGNIQAAPYKCDNDEACKYCEYIAICMFDVRMDGYKFNNVKKLKKKEVIEKIINSKKRNDNN